MCFQFRARPCVRGVFSLLVTLRRRCAAPRDIPRGLLICKRTRALAHSRRACTFACKRGCIQTRSRCRSYFKPRRSYRPRNRVSGATRATITARFLIAAFSARPVQCNVFSLKLVKERIWVVCERHKGRLLIICNNHQSFARVSLEELPYLLRGPAYLYILSQVVKS